jgi:predicted transcriptional regulator
MTLAEVKQILECEVIHGGNLHGREITMGCGCDLMSDVLRFIKPNSLLLTGLTHAQVIRTCEMADINAICFVRGKKPDEETIRLAKENGIWLLATRLPLFESCGRLYRAGLPGCSEY